MPNVANIRAIRSNFPFNTQSKSIYPAEGKNNVASKDFSAMITNFPDIPCLITERR